MITTDEISTFLAKKRTASGERLQWANHIIERSLQLIEEKGNFADAHGTEIRPKTVTHKSLSILYSTPFNRLESIPSENVQYLLDIWNRDDGKVFSVCWEPIEIIRFKRAEWLYELFS
jgi:hypothetical protein